MSNSEEEGKVTGGRMKVEKSATKEPRGKR